MKSSPFRKFRELLLVGCAGFALTPALAQAGEHTPTLTRLSGERFAFDIPAQDLGAALTQFGQQGEQETAFSADIARERAAPAVRGQYTREEALEMLLANSGLSYRMVSGTVLVEPMVRRGAALPQLSSADVGAKIDVVKTPRRPHAAETVSGSAVEGLVVTAQKRRENIQDVPIAISAFTQDKLEVSQIATGADLMTQVPNMTFTKTNFTGYSIQVRGIGTQAISATTDPAVSVSHNNTAYIRNRFFEQEFFDVERLEVLRGPQGTLYGRNATAGVVNIITAKPVFDYEAKLSGDVANYNSKRLEGMINLPLVEDKAALRLAGAWTKRDGFVDNQITGNPIDGRDLWSSRLSLRVAPTEALDVNFIWEHFEENDDRLRSGKQLCHQDNRYPFQNVGYSNVLNQGCVAASLYSPESFQAPDGYSLPYYLPLKDLFVPIIEGFNPYASLTQSRDLRVIESTVDPKYKANSDVVELQLSYDLNDNLTFTSETSYNYDTVYSSEDYNRFNTASGAFQEAGATSRVSSFMHLNDADNWEFCDPQIGCADSVVAVDVSRAKSSQFSQEFRINSNYDGPFNFSAGVNYLRYDTEDKYYVFINTLTMASLTGTQGVNIGTMPAYDLRTTDNRECMIHGAAPPDPTTYYQLRGCIAVDPNSIEDVNDLGHNYFLSRNPYKLISYAAFGEAYWNVTHNLKLTAGLRLTRDQKEAPRIPSWLLATQTVGLSVLAVEEQEWTEPTGRLAIDWKPDLSFTDDTLLYASYSHGYKAGGSNPPPAGVVVWGITGLEQPEGQIKVDETAAKPKIFDPEFVDAFEIGTKNTFFDGALTANLAAFYYDYSGYQISQIIDRSAVNYNFDATIWGLEFESDWQVAENFRLGLKAGYEHTEIADGERAIDIMDRTAGRADWTVVRPFPSFPSNCILPTAAAAQGFFFAGGFMGPCEEAYLFGHDPVTRTDYVQDPYPGYAGFDPHLDYGNNNGEGFFKELGGNELPNAPHFTATLTGDYTLPLPADWLVTLHADAYYQSEAWTRVFNTDGYDKLKAYTNVNFAAVFTNENAGLKVMAYVKNAFDRDSITGAFLNSDDTGLTTNVFLTEPRLYGVRVTKDFSGGPWWTGARLDHKGPYPLWIELGGMVMREDAPYETLAPDQFGVFSAALNPTIAQNRDLDWGDSREVRVTYKPVGEGLSFKGSARWGDVNSGSARFHQSEAAGPLRCVLGPNNYFHDIWCVPGGPLYSERRTGTNWSDSYAREKEEHLVVEFAVGKELGLGSLADSRSTLSAGLRYGQFKSHTDAVMDGIPNMNLPEGFGFEYNTTFDQYRAIIEARREFEGVGPVLSWDAAQRLLGNEDVGHLDVDWSVGGGILFGRQKATIGETDGGFHFDGIYDIAGATPLATVMGPLTISTRSTETRVPFLDLSAGLSYQIQRLKVSAGYRWERYFDVLDAGYTEHKDYDRTMDGPYFKVALGFGE